MTNVPSDTPRSNRLKPVRTSIEVVAKAARAALGLRYQEQAFELPARLFEQLPFAVYVSWPMCCAPVFLCANRRSTLSDRTARAASRSLTSRQSRIAAETLSAP